MLKLTRQELYDMVWAEPVAKVAQRYFLSGSGLRKICVKHNVPVPPRGYWARIAAGQKVKPTNLPSPKTADEVVYLPKRTPQPGPLSPLPEVESIQQQREYEADPKNRVEVRFDGRRVHLWARGIRKQLNYSGPRYGHSAGERPPSPLTVSASSGVVERVERIIDALGRAADRRGATLVEIKSMDRYYTRTETRLHFHDANFRLRLSERTKRIRRGSDSKPPEPILPSWFAVPTDTYWFKPSGELRLTLTGTVTTRTYWNSQYPLQEEITLKDKRDNPLEQQLHAVFITLATIAAHLHEKKREHEERRRLEEAERIRQAHLARQREVEAQTLRELENLADRHARAARLRELIAAVERTGIVPGPASAPADLREWLTWARAYAKRLDPVSSLDGA